jgi:sec-independent protein translocase protein TatA
MNNIGIGEILIIFLIIIIFFGSKKIPEFIKGLGDAVHEFKKATKEPGKK